MADITNPTFIKIVCKCKDVPKKEFPKITHDEISVQLTLCSNCELNPNFAPFLEDDSK